MRLWVFNQEAFSNFDKIIILYSNFIPFSAVFLSDLLSYAASTQNQAFNALLFFYRHIIKIDIGDRKRQSAGYTQSDQEFEI